MRYDHDSIINNRTLENLNDLFDNMVRYAVANTPYILHTISYSICQ
jgi:hypothetical protein